MIRTLFPLILVAGLTACASSGPQNAASDSTPAYDTSSSTSSGNASMTNCDAEPVQNLVGQKYSESRDSQLKSGANATQLRVLKPGQVMTMEYNPSRLNVIVESDDAISALRCG